MSVRERERGQVDHQERYVGERRRGVWNVVWGGKRRVGDQ